MKVWGSRLHRSGSKRVKDVQPIGARVSSSVGGVKLNENWHLLGTCSMVDFFQSSPFTDFGPVFPVSAQRPSEFCICPLQPMRRGIIALESLGVASGNEQATRE